MSKSLLVFFLLFSLMSSNAFASKADEIENTNHNDFIYTLSRASYCGYDVKNAIKLFDKFLRKKYGSSESYLAARNSGIRYIESGEAGQISIEEKSQCKAVKKELANSVKKLRYFVE